VPVSASLAILDALKTPGLSDAQRLALVAALESLTDGAEAPATKIISTRKPRTAAPERKAESVRLTRESIAAMELPKDGERLVYDTACQQLAIRLRPGSRTYVFVMWDRERRRAVKVTLGKVGTLTPEQARNQAQRKVAEVADGKDARRKVPDSVTVGDVWAVYLRQGKPRKKEAWKPRYRLDLERAAALGGETKKRGEGVTKPGPLASLMGLRLSEINRDALSTWHSEQAKRGPVQAARAAAMFAGFITWCSTRTDYRDLVDETAAKASNLAHVLPPLKRRTDALDRAHLPAWFAAVRALSNATAAAYLQALVLTGARREEMGALAWADVDTKAGTLTINDKFEARRTIPLTPHLAGLIDSLPRLNAFVFASPTAKSGHIAEPRSPLEDALKAAELPHLSIHGLRRSFALFGEAAGVPAGAVAQVMGHKPSATHEGYKPRRIEDLREHAERIERFILERAGIMMDGAAS
jgi:integrase